MSGEWTLIIFLSSRRAGGGIQLSCRQERVGYSVGTCSVFIPPRDPIVYDH